MEAGTKLAPARAKAVPGPFAFDPLRNLLRFNRAFENVFPYAPQWDEGLATTAWTPACDIFDTAPSSCADLTNHPARQRFRHTAAAFAVPAAEDSGHRPRSEPACPAYLVAKGGRR